MYGLMVAFYPTRTILVARGRNEGLNFVNVIADSEGTGDRDHGGDGGIGRKLECWNCVGDHLKKEMPKACQRKRRKKGRRLRRQ